MHNSSSHSLFLRIFVYFYFFVAIYTALGTFFFEWARDTPFDFYEKVNEQSIVLAIFLFLCAGSLFLLGWRFASYIFRSRRYLFGRDENIPYLPVSVRRMIVLVNILLVLLVFLGYGVADLIHREGYAVYGVERDDFYLKLHRLILPIAIFGLAFVKVKSIRYFFILLNWVVLLSLSTRMLGMVFVIYAMGQYCRNGYRMNIKTLVLVVVGLYFFVWTLSIRNLAPHGFLPNMGYLFSFNDQVLDYAFLGMNYVTSFSIYGLAFSIENSVSDVYSYLVSLSPLPLSFYDADRMLESQRLSGTSPMSSVAINYSMGWIVFSLFYICLGMATFYFTSLLKPGGAIYIVSLSIFSLAVFLSVQYNLRGFSRLLYFCWGVAVFSRFTFKRGLQWKNV